MLILIVAGLGPAAVAGSGPSASADSSPRESQAIEPASSLAAMADYSGKIVKSIELPGVSDSGRLVAMLPQKAGGPLDRDKVRESIRILFSTGLFSDLQAEVTPSSPGVRLTFTSSPNFFIGSINVQGAPSRPNANQVVNAAKFQLGELYTADKLNRALQNIRQLMQENGYYRARVTAETTSNAATRQADLLFHIAPGAPAHVGEVNVAANAAFSRDQVEQIARMHTGDRVTASRVNNSLQRLRKKLQKQQRVIAQVSISAQTYHPDSNSVDYTYLIDPGPVVILYATGFRISRGVLRREVPIYQENAIDDDLLNEGKSNLLNYLQSRGRIDASVQVQKENSSSMVRVVYHIDPGPVHKFVLLAISGN
ncbi:MAG: POTRA domain-containing protein, partial [Candidatus Sulfotelmatobacter sp.]